MKKIFNAVLAVAALAATAITATTANAAILSQADCNYAMKKLEQFNAKMKPGQRTTFEEKATYAYAEACQAAGLTSIPGYLQAAPDASPEIAKYCADNARSRGEAERCLATGSLD